MKVFDTLRNKRHISTAVLNRIREVERSNELLITYLQFGFVMMMSVLYTISPKGFSIAEALFQPVPIALAIWFVLLVLRLLICVRDRMRGFLVYLFIIVDIILLTALIFSFHVQYESTPAISLKAPTYIFLILMVVLRGLRYNVRYIVVSAALVIAGWTSLLVYATRNSPVTHSYLEYASNNVVLVGAEIERLIGISAIAVVIAIFVYKTRSVLIYSQQQTEAVRSLSQFFNPKVARRISGDTDGGLHPGVGEERDAVILNIDLRGFTTFSAKQSVATVMKTLSDYQSLLVPIINRNEGSIDKFMGDGILFHYGVVDDNRDYAARALRTVEQIIHAFATWNEERRTQRLPAIDFGIGMECGKVLFGTVGDVGRLEFTVIGGAVNNAAKFEKATKRFSAHCVCSLSSYKMAVGQGYSPKASIYLRKRQQVEGIADALDVVIVHPKDRQTG